MTKFESRSKKKRIRGILKILRCEHPFRQSKAERLVKRWCTIYGLPCNYPEHTPHLSCRNCGGKFAVVERKRRT